MSHASEGGAGPEEGGSPAAAEDVRSDLDESVCRGAEEGAGSNLEEGVSLDPDESASLRPEEGLPDRPEPWATRALRLCLAAWPEPAHDRDGTALVQTVLEDLSTRRGRARRVSLVLFECWAIVKAGLGMRLNAFRDAAADGSTAWSSDVRQTVRSLRRDPGFTLTTAVTLALGIGANAAVFGVVDRVASEPPHASPEGLVFVWTTRDGEDARQRTAAPDAAALRRGVDGFAGIGFVARPVDAGLAVDPAGTAEHVTVARVSANLFFVLGDRAVLGTPPYTIADGPGAGVTLSHDLWVRSFGADEAVVGRTVRLGGGPVRVAGVMPEGYHIAMPPDVGMGDAVDVWAPLPAPLADFRRTDGRFVDQDSDNTGAVIARLRAGATTDGVAGQVDRTAESLRAEVPAYARSGLGFTTRPLRRDATAHLDGLLTALLLGSLALLGVVCLNVSTLALARATRKRTETELRLCLGAGRLRIVRRAWTEAVLLVAAGIALSWIVAEGMVWRLGATASAGVLGIGGVAWDGGAAVAAATVCALATVLATVGPALQVGRRVHAGRPRETRTLPARLRGSLVLGQVAISVVLLSTTGIVAREAVRLHGTDTGFQPDGAISFALSLRGVERARGPADRSSLVQDVRTMIADLPGVSSVGMTAHLPLSGTRWAQPYGAAGLPEDDWSGRRADFHSVGSGYFAALGIPLLDGRTFTERENLFEDERVIVIDEALARRLAPTGSAVGERLSVPLDGAVIEAEIVGVVGRVRTEGLTGERREAVYVPYRQEASRDVWFVARLGTDAATSIEAIRRAVHDVDPSLPVYGLRPMTEYVADMVAPTTMALLLIGAFAAVVLLSVAVGIYGIVALDVVRRTPEIGLRLAVGATRGNIVRRMVRRAFTLSGAGLGAGIVLAAVTSRLTTKAAPGGSIADPLVWGAVIGTVLGVTLAASLMPATRASRLDPGTALRPR